MDKLLNALIAFVLFASYIFGAVEPVQAATDDCIIVDQNLNIRVCFPKTETFDFEAPADGYVLVTSAKYTLQASTSDGTKTYNYLLNAGDLVQALLVSSKDGSTFTLKNYYLGSVAVTFFPKGVVENPNEFLRNIIWDMVSKEGACGQNCNFAIGWQPNGYDQIALRGGSISVDPAVVKTNEAGIHVDYSFGGQPSSRIISEAIHLIDWGDGCVDNLGHLTCSDARDTLYQYQHVYLKMGIYPVSLKLGVMLYCHDWAGCKEGEFVFGIYQPPAAQITVLPSAVVYIPLVVK